MATFALVIMDGFGNGGNDPKSNAILAQGTPNLDRLKKEYCYTAIGASGEDVGLPDGQMGNSEVGHTNIGAGRVVYQMLVKITKDIRDGVFFENKALLAAMENCKKNDTALHLIGLVSPGGVHSHTKHLYGLLEMAKKHGLTKVYVHALLDGRDVPPDSAWEYVQELEDKMKEIGVGRIATTMGRLYAMDRDKAWERVEKAYNAMVCGEGIHATDAVQAIKDSYQVVDETGKHLTDEFVLPTVLDENGMIKANDSVIFFNFRPDRAREITRAFVDPDFDGFTRKHGFFPLTYVCMTQYDATMPNVLVAYPPESLHMTMGEYLSECGKTQLRIAETQKYAHVTFFFNGGEERTFKGEDRILIPSPKAEPFKQWMAQIASDRLDQLQDPELSIEQAMIDYKRLGYSDNWINQRLKSIEVRKLLTDEWKRGGVDGTQYATLTDIITMEWAGRTTKAYKRYKGLKKENLRDNMTNVELLLNSLAEASATELSRNENPKGFKANANVAKRGGTVARVARQQLEHQLGHSVVSPLNARQYLGTLPDNPASETAYLTSTEKTTKPIICDDSEDINK